MKRFCLFAMAVIMVVCFAPRVARAAEICPHGYYTFGDHRKSTGVGNYGSNRQYYWTGGFDSTWKGYINEAVMSWVNTTSGVGVTTPISIRETTSRNSAYYEFENLPLLEGTLGYTKFYKFSKVQVDSESSNWDWAHITLDVQCMTKIGMASSQMKATCAHELGHAMGLSHRNGTPTSIMCQYEYQVLGGGWIRTERRTATGPSASDCNTINHLY